MFSKRSLEGEILIDHTASPGLTPEEVGTFAEVSVAKGGLFESAINTCGHCSFTVVLNPKRTRDRGWCSHCDRYLCDACTYQLHLTLTCKNVKHRMEKILNEIEKHGPSPLLIPTEL